MSMLPKTVGELIKYLETYPQNLEIMIQGDTESDPNAVPVHFVVEFWDYPASDPPFILLAGIAPQSGTGTFLAKNDPNHSRNLPK